MAAMTDPAPSASPVAAPAAKPAGHRHHAHHQHANAFHHHVQRAAHAPAEAAAALKAAMGREGVPDAWENSLRYIMEKESAGKVGAANKVDTARGLFQLTRASYHLNPNGAASFGNGVEEAQGGIRYIQQRYQTADNAAAFWQRHGWY